MSDENDQFSELKVSIKKQQSQGYKKIRAYFFELVRSEYIEKRCNFIRLMNDIPDGGYRNRIPDGAADWAMLTEIPSSWLKRMGDEGFNQLRISVERLCDELGLYDDVWGVILQNYLFYDKLPSQDALAYESFDLCTISDEIEVENAFSILAQHEDKSLFNGLLQSRKRLDDHFPAVLHISPYASKRDLIDYVTKNFNKIKSIQSKYRNEFVDLGKIREKDQKIVERDTFIFENKALSNKDLVSAVGKKFDKKYSDPISEGSVGKTISLEEERRLYLAGKRGKVVKEELKKSGISPKSMRKLGS